MDSILDSRSGRPLPAPLFSLDNDETTVLKIGGTYYEVTSRFNKDGIETVLQQFMDLLHEEKII